MSGAKSYSVSDAQCYDDPVAAEFNRSSTQIIQEDGIVRYVPDFLSQAYSDQLLARSLDGISWVQHHINLFGKSVAVPRLSAWYSIIDATYKYSGLVHRPQHIPDFVSTVLNTVVSKTGIDFNSILVSLYRDGSHSMGWHSDDESELGPEVIIASLSLGAQRVFRFRHRHNKGLSVAVPVEHGSLLMMYPPLQEFWQHELPKRKNVSMPRVNFSFRLVRP